MNRGVQFPVCHFAWSLMLMVLASRPAAGQIHVEPDEGPQFGAVHIQPVDILGHPMRQFRVFIIGVGALASVHAESQTGDFPRIPYGDFVIRVSAAGFKTVERVIGVDRPTVWVTVPLAVSSHFAESVPVLSGKVIPAITEGKAWAKLVGVYDNSVIEAAVTTEGRFHFEPKTVGIYVLLIVNEDRVLSMERIELMGYKYIEIHPTTP